MRHREHVALDKIVFGRSFRHVHRWMDEPYKWLGPRHRIVRHDPLTLLAKYGLGDEFLAGVLHIIADASSSRRRPVRRRNLLELLVR